MGFLDRLKFLWPANAKPSDFYNKIDMSASGFNRIWKDGAIPTAEYLVKIQEVTGCDLNWLLTGQGEPYLNAKTAVPPVAPERSDAITDTLGNPVDLDEFVFIPRYSAKAAAGHGYPGNSDKPTFSMAFRAYWIRNFLGADPKDLSVISIKGDSMEGVLNERDNILVNHAKNQPGNGLYVVCIGNDLIVKHTQVLPGNRLLLKSANEIYEPVELNLADESAGVQIIGRVEWFGRQI